MFDAANAAIDHVITRSRTQLHQHRTHGTDNEFIESLIAQFTTEAQRHPAGAGSAHMALAVYRLIVAQETIAHLEEQLAMRDDVLEFTWKLRE